MQKWIILIVIAVIAIIGVFIVMNVSIETEYIPESEVEETELRKTIVSLYFKDKTTEELVKETRMIDSKELLKNPYNALVKMLIDGPENTNYEKAIPEGTSIIDITFESGCVIINFSKEFSENIETTKLQTNINSIYQTLRELTEVTSIKILVEGVEIEC